MSRYSPFVKIGKNHYSYRAIAAIARVTVDGVDWWGLSTEDDTSWPRVIHGNSWDESQYFKWHRHRDMDDGFTEASQRGDTRGKNRHVIRRWIARFRVLCRVAADAFDAGRRGAAIRVLCEMLHMDIAISMCPMPQTWITFSNSGGTATTFDSRPLDLDTQGVVEMMERLSAEYMGRWENPFAGGRDE